MVILKMVFLFTISLPELYPVSVLQNFTSALLTGCVTVILQMIKTSSQLMEKTLRHSYDKSRQKGAIYVIKIRLHIVCMSLMNLLILRLNGKG